MRPIIHSIGAALLALSLCSCSNSAKVAPTPKFSTFSDHVISVSRQDTSSLLDAVKWVQSIGITGIDARTTLTDDQMKDIIGGGLQPACAILDLSYSKQTAEERAEMGDKAIEFCKKYGFERLMYCPVLLPEGATDQMRDEILKEVKQTAEKVIASGIDLIFEDYDNARSVSFNMEAIDKLFELIPAANHAYDTGNFFFAGDDPMVAFKRYRDRISHVHLKDRIAVGNSASPAAGTGVVPCLEVVHQLLSEGYDGWFTIEGYGARDMKDQLKVSVENMLK